jgi:hypothetical protein
MDLGAIRSFGRLRHSLSETGCGVSKQGNGGPTALARSFLSRQGGQSQKKRAREGPFANTVELRGLLLGCGLFAFAFFATLFVV